MPSLHRVAFSTLVVLLTGLAAPSDRWQTQKKVKRQSVSYQSPNTESSKSLYHHRAYHSSIVVGEYLYIHGGEITTWNGSGPGIDSDPNTPNEVGNITTLPNNYTYSIDLSSSWTNKTVVLKATDSEAPTLMSQALWNDPSNSSFYAYDGGLSYAIALGDPPPNQLWQFEPLGSSGAWSQVEQPASSNFTSLSRVQAEIDASGGGLGFALGGLQNPATGNPQGTIDTPGMVIYNFTSMEWFNVSTKGYSFNGIAMDGAGIFVPTFGTAGLLFVLAGLVGASSAGSLPLLDSIFMYDPTSRQWSSQQTSGTAPAPITDPCVVGAQSDNNTYEIFLYGGLGGTPQHTVANDAVFVLSLPAFNWQRSEYTPTLGRRRHSCNVIGNRQMVAVGGQVSQPNSLTPDPWDQGLGIFDMSAMQWKDKYDPNAGAYVSPDSVKAYYQHNGRYPASWSNNMVETWFTKAAANNTANTNPGASSDNPTGSPGTKKGAIAGGIIGGVAALALIVTFVIYLLRRRRRRAAAAAAAAQPSDLGDGYQKAELGDNRKEVPSELPGVGDAPKVVPASELPYWQEMHELPVERPELAEGRSHELG